MEADVFKTINLNGFGKKYSGKVRDYYIVDPSARSINSGQAGSGQVRILITTDRISAFDVNLGFIPYKGAVLNLLSQFWFEKTSDIVRNHMISLPDPNVMIVKNARPIPIEMVVRGYITGVTSTSIWGSYEKGERIIYGIKFPDNLKKNQKLKNPVITPTTKAEVGHDERLTEKDILSGKVKMKDGIVSPNMWRKMKKASLALFEKGQKICDKAGIILVDTKYEFGSVDGKLILIDEMHTPDSSRFWVKATYKERFKKGLEPENFDKEFLRIWYVNHGYKGDGKPPKMPRNLQKAVSKRYISIYEKITGKKFVPDRSKNIDSRIKENLNRYFR